MKTEQAKPLEQDQLPLSGLPSDYQDRFRHLSETFLTKKNQYLKAKEIADQLKGEQDEAEWALIQFAQNTGCLSATYKNLGHFSISEQFFGNVKQQNIQKVFAYFREQKRELDFFQTAPKKSEFNRYVRTKIDEFKRSSEFKNGGEIKLQLPDGIDMITKWAISIRGRNEQFGLTTQE